MVKNTDVEHELSQGEEDDTPSEGLAPITYFGADFDVAGLVRRLNNRDILIPSYDGTSSDDGEIESETFQRSFVWNKYQADRFIESILLGYPIPGIFLVEQSTKSYLVLDGQQRLRVLQMFVKGTFEDRNSKSVVFELDNVASDFKGISYASLEKNNPELRRMFDNTFIAATIIKLQENNASYDSVYEVFERLNSGGVKLTPHEIRVALYAGPFVNLLGDLASNESWRSLYGRAPAHLKDQELILRILALHAKQAQYRRPLKQYLNNFMGANRKVQAGDPYFSQITTRFLEAVEQLQSVSGEKAFRPYANSVNIAFAEAIVVALMDANGNGRITEAEVKDAVAALQKSEDMRGFCSKATADENSLNGRLNVAKEAFSRA